jgi:hypothetical protein
MSIHWISLAQFILPGIIGMFFGNLLSIFVDKKFFSEQGETPNRQKVLSAILSSVKISFYGVPWLVLWLSLFIVVPLYWNLVVLGR